MKRPYTPRDHYYKEAKRSGLRARSAFKLEEIAQRHKLLGTGDCVLDLGAAPGGFLQIIRQKVGPGGHVVGMDLVDIQPMGHPNVVTLAADVWDASLGERLRQLAPRPYDVVVSDMAPKTTGVKSTDEARSEGLVERALELASCLSRPGAHFVAKLFMGRGFEGLRAAVRSRYTRADVVRPEATRGASMEIYLVGLGRRATA